MWCVAREPEFEFQTLTTKPNADPTAEVLAASPGVVVQLASYRLTRSATTPTLIHWSLSAGPDYPALEGYFGSVYDEAVFDVPWRFDLSSALILTAPVGSGIYIISCTGVKRTVV